MKLKDHLEAKEAGITTLDQSIISILDELLRIKVLNNNQYDDLYKNYLL